MKALLKNGVAWLALVMIFIGALPASGQSGQGIWYAGTHPGQTWTALKSDYSGRWNSGLRGQGSIFGEGLLTIATLGAGFADDAGTVGRIGNMTRKLDAALPDEVVPKKGPPVIIGETMRRVNTAAKQYPGATILDDMPNFKAMGMSADEVTSSMMQYNRKWILDQMRSGREIIDIGVDANRATPSIFYQMEQNMLKNYQKLHPTFPGAVTQ